MHLAYLLVALCFVLMVPQTISFNKWKFMRCAGSNLFTCPGEKLKARYDEMIKANCKKCDKFFHCEGNFDAVNLCRGFQSENENKRIAKKISDCREEAQDAGSEDSRADQEANEFGRNGGACDKKYLCKAGCKYNPFSGTCRRENCQFFA